MTESKLPSLEHLVRKKIQRRIFAAMVLLIAGAGLVTILEAVLSYSDLVARLDRRANTLQNLIISEVLVNNDEATRDILADANLEEPDQQVIWLNSDKTRASTLSNGLSWQFPGNWSFVRPLKRLGEQDFGTFVFSGNFFIAGSLVSALTHRLAFAIIICIFMGILLLPIARRASHDLILEPVKHLLQLVRSDFPKQESPSYPHYSEIKQIEDDFIALMDEKRRLEDQRLETEQMRAITRTAQMLAHDIRRPFSLLNAVLDTLAYADTPELVRELIETTAPGVKRSLMHLDGTLEELMTLGNPNVSQKDSVSVTDFVRKGVANALNQDKDAENRISFDLQNDLYVKGCASQLERVIANIVSNAFEAMAFLDRVWITGKSTADIVTIAIRNSGTFIPAAEQNKIFQLFYTKGKKTGKPGTGIGLAICKRIVLDHHGVISVASDINQGTTFIISLPKDSSPVAIAAKINESALNHEPIRLLIADDESIYRNQILKKVRHGLAHVELSETSTAEGAIQIAKDQCPNIIVMDLDFGRGQMDGIQAIKAIRSSGSTAKIVVHSNNIDPQTRSEVLSAGANLFLHKSLAGQELLAILRA
jgi:signal transduction histidine kinase/CheY-like chemotaxis protein